MNMYLSLPRTSQRRVDTTPAASTRLRVAIQHADRGARQTTLVRGGNERDQRAATAHAQDVGQQRLPVPAHRRRLQRDVDEVDLKSADLQRGSLQLLVVCFSSAIFLRG